MAISFTRVEVGSRDVAGPSAGAAVAVANGAVSTALTQNGYYRIVATTASLVLFSASATDGTGGEHWPEGHVEVRALSAGLKIGVSAP